MFSHKRASFALALFICAAPFAAALEKQERVIAGGPKDSLEVRYLMLRGTNEEIGRALAEIAAERYNVRPDASRDALRTRALRRFIEQTYPILYDRMRGVAAAFDHRIDDDAWQHSYLGFTELRAGCSIIHLPPSSTANGKSVISRDYDFSTGSLSFGPLAAGMLHPTARPYLIELHPDRGYASISMVAYDLLSGVLDGMNSEGLVVTLAMDDEIFSKYKVEPTVVPATGLGELQMLRMLLDTCANVDEAKELLLRTKQYYEYVPVHYLIADRFGRSFVWEYSEAHNKEYFIENPGQPLVMTNFSLHKHMDGEKAPTADLARAVCKRYAFVADRLANAPSGITEELLRKTHRAVDAQAPPARDPSHPPERTFWHALYYPEERRVKLSYYLRDEPVPGDTTKVKIVRSDYVEFSLDSTSRAALAPAPVPARLSASPNSADRGEQVVIERLKSANAVYALERDHVTSVSLENNSDAVSILPLLAKLPKLRVLQLARTKITDDDLARLADLKALEELSLRSTAVTDAGMPHLTALPNLRVLSLTDTVVGDGGLVHIGKLVYLQGLILTGTKVTDAGLVHIKPLRLTKLNVARTAVTEQGAAEAKKSLPFWATVQR